MIIYPSESFAKGQELSEKKLNTYFDYLTQLDESDAEPSIFSEDGVSAFVDGEAEQEQYVYVVLPLIEFICFEVFNTNNKSSDSFIHIKSMMKQWADYVQVARSHISLFSSRCKWRRFHMEMNESQRELYHCFERLLLSDELKELDDIVRVSCGAPINEDNHKVTELQLSSKLAKNYAVIAQAEKRLKQTENSEIEKAALEVKCEKLLADVNANESIAAEHKALLQGKTAEVEALTSDLEGLKQAASTAKEAADTEIASLKQNIEQKEQVLLNLRQEINVLQDNNLSQTKALNEAVEAKKLSEDERTLIKLQLAQLQDELETTFGARVRAETQLETERQAFEKKQTCIQEEKDAIITSLKEECELIRLQFAQLQEELETIYAAKDKMEKQLETVMVEVNVAKLAQLDDDALTNIQNENELMQLQIAQLQEELEFYFKKANSVQWDNVGVESGKSENLSLNIANKVSENHNTLNLINRLITAQGRDN